MTPEEIKKVKVELLWELIEEWQMEREPHIDINDPALSYNDVEISLYDKLAKIDSSVNLNNNKQ